jgi:hypothetical protein
MAGNTNHYQLIKLDKGDPFSTNGQQYTTADRDTIDRILHLGAQRPPPQRAAVRSWPRRLYGGCRPSSAPTHCPSQAAACPSRAEPCRG